MFQDNKKDTRTKAIACLGLSQRLAVAAASIECFDSEDNCLKKILVRAFNFLETY